jgi:UDP-3-O-[3-hydroxymyristoyl] N-acetylglucosamine deacetylase
MRNPAEQRTVGKIVKFDGVGLHTGVSCRLALTPAGAGDGIVFRRLDVRQGDNEISAAPEHVVSSDHGTTIANGRGASVATIEHLMAAFALCGVDNAIVDLDGPEVPILDGSAAIFVRAIAETGLQKLDAPRQPLILRESFRVEDRDRSILFEPGDGRRLDIEIAFDDCFIGRQVLSLDLTDPEDLVKLSTARTFCRLHEVAALRAAGLIRGGALENSLVVDGDRLVNEEPLRDPAEFALHKALDLIGDLYLLGAPIIGHIRAVKPGHDLNTRAARLLARRVFPETAAAPLRATA